MTDQHTTPDQENQQEQPQAEPTMADLEQRIAALELQAEDYKEQWARATADFRNLKRRTEQERSEMIRSASANLILKLLPIIDDFDRAMEYVPEDLAGHPWVSGLEMVHRKLNAVLEGEGVQAIEAEGQTFDPNMHEAVMHEDVGADQDGKVLAELQKGYKLGDRVLRPTIVKVGRSS